MDMNPWTIHCGDVGVSIKLHLPDVPKAFLERAGTPFTNYSAKHLEWRKGALPWVDHETHVQYAPRELEAMQNGFPLIDDEASALGLAACLVVVCEVDDLIEEMDLQTAETCVETCVRILRGEESNTGRVGLLSFKTGFEKAQIVCREYQSIIRKLFNHYSATLVLQDMQEMILGQIPEKHLILGESMVKDFPSYIAIRKRAFGLAPLLRIAENLCLGESDAAHRMTESSLIKEQVRHMAIPQNDAGGLEKDLKTENKSNSLFILAKLEGRSIKNKEDVQASADILRRFEEKHNNFVAGVVDTWAKIQSCSVLKGEIVMSNMMLALCVTYLEWTLGSKRYVAAETGKLSGGDT